MLSHASQSKLMALIIKRDFGALTVIFSPNAITTQKIANFQYTVERV